MYEHFYNLRERPFALSPDPEYLYLSRVHSEALDSIRYGIESRAGFIIVTGEIGAGKTTLLQSILQRLDDRTVIARVVNTMLEPRELLEAVALDFGLADVSKSKPVLVRDLGMFLVEQRRQGRRPLLVIDEAQNLGPQALEEVRLLSNLETEKSKLLQILLAGQPNLRDTIASPELEQFRQRIAVSYHLRPLAADETTAYINFRLQHAALGEPVRFPEDACSLIHEVSGGVPRVINVVCDAVLVFGYAEERRTIDRAMIDEVITELEETSVVRRPAATASATARPAVVTAAAPPLTAPATAAGAAAVPSMGPPRPTPAPAAASTVVPVIQTPIAPPPFAARAETQPIRDRALAAASDPPLQAPNLASARDELAVEREAIARRLRELAAREQALLERDRQVAEQRRIMGEEYRLLRQTQPARSAPAFPARSVAINKSAMPVAQREPELSLWQRLSRLFGWGHAVRS
jgi:putative secretion ATPase (PEP-CTERM system associated)